MTLCFNFQQNSDEDKIDVYISRCVFQQHKTPICVRSILKTSLVVSVVCVREFGFWLLFLFPFRNLRDNNLSTLSWRTFQNFNSTLPWVCTKASFFVLYFQPGSLPCAAFLSSRLLLSGNPLDCVCENMWIKLRLLEDPDSQDLKCIDEREVPKAFATLTPPDCGNVKPCYNKQRWGMWYWTGRERWSLHGDRKGGNETVNKSILSSGRMFNLAICSFLAVVPSVEVTPNTVTAMKGSNAKAVCKASGSPPPEIVWNLDWLATTHKVSWATTPRGVGRHHSGLMIFFFFKGFTL